MTEEMTGDTERESGIKEGQGEGGSGEVRGKDEARSYSRRRKGE